jgi:hypothetical protein
MQVNHQINMTRLFADFSKLQESINIETIDTKSVQDTLQKINIMKDLDNFNPTQLHLEKLSHLSTWTAVLFWLIAALGVVATCCCCYCLCPACCGQCITCFCTSLCKCIPLPKIPKRVTAPIRSFSRNIYEAPVYYQHEESQIRIPSHASAPREPSQVTHSANLIDNDISLINFNSTISKSPNPINSIAKNKWKLVKETNRVVLKCDDIYYCATERRCVYATGKTAYVAFPDMILQQQLQATPKPPLIPVKYEQNEKKICVPIWHFSDTDTREWHSHRWYSKQNERYHYGYGDPEPNPNPPKN